MRLPLAGSPSFRFFFRAGQCMRTRISARSFSRLGKRLRRTAKHSQEWLCYSGLNAGGTHLRKVFFDVVIDAMGDGGLLKVLVSGDVIVNFRRLRNEAKRGRDERLLLHFPELLYFGSSLHLFLFLLFASGLHPLEIFQGGAIVALE